MRIKKTDLKDKTGSATHNDSHRQLAISIQRGIESYLKINSSDQQQYAYSCSLDMIERT